MSEIDEKFFNLFNAPEEAQRAEVRAFVQHHRISPVMFQELLASRALMREPGYFDGLVDVAMEDVLTHQSGIYEHYIAPMVDHQVWEAVGVVLEWAAKEQWKVLRETVRPLWELSGPHFLTLVQALSAERRKTGERHVLAHPLLLRDARLVERLRYTPGAAYELLPTGVDDPLARQVAEILVAGNVLRERHVLGFVTWGLNGKVEKFGDLLDALPVTRWEEVAAACGGQGHADGLRAVWERQPTASVAWAMALELVNLSPSVWKQDFAKRVWATVEWDTDKVEKLFDVMSQVGTKRLASHLMALHALLPENGKALMNGIVLNGAFPFGEEFAAFREKIVLTQNLPSTPTLSSRKPKL